MVVWRDCANMSNLELSLTPAHNIYEYACTISHKCDSLIAPICATGGVADEVASKSIKLALSALPRAEAGIGAFDVAVAKLFAVAVADDDDADEVVAVLFCLRRLSI